MPNRNERRGRPSAVPSHRINRLAGFGLLTAGIAGRTLFEGARSLSRGKLPTPADLLLTPANILKLSDELARMRGAALKLGQLLSMDAGEFLPRELADLMTRLRSDADFMPVSQLNSVLKENWGEGWQSRFVHFDLHPIASASIGQVHRAKTTDGRELAVKVQYPGIALSIDSDIDNVVSLFRLTGLAPPTLKLQSIIEEAKKQLHEEADYAEEAQKIDRFTRQLGNQHGFTLPSVQTDLSTKQVLAMSFVPGKPIETVAEHAQEQRDRIFTCLVHLALDEVFRFGFVQTDPNFANYTYDSKTGNIGLLDFGAAREFPTEFVDLCKLFLQAGLDGKRDRLRAVAKQLTLYTDKTPAHHRSAIDRMIVILFGAVRQRPIFDFSDAKFMQDLRNIGMELAIDRDFVEVPQVDLLYLQRKAAGMYLLGRRLGARIPLREILLSYTTESQSLRQQN